MTILRLGDKGNEVKKLQQLLGITADGIFGPKTLEAVKEYQKAKGLTVDGIVGEKTWSSLGVSDDKLSLKKSVRNIKEIIVHCTATKENVNVTVEQIKKYHLSKGWNDIAYHYVIYLDGSIHNGRPVDRIGGHTTNHNAYSIGVVYVGGLDSKGKAKDTRTAAQKKALLELLKELKAIYPNAKIYGHRDFANKACPCFDAKDEYKNI